MRRDDRARSFIAAELSEEAREGVWECEQALRRHIGSEMKWVEKANLHVTLRFLGEVEASLLEECVPVLEQACRDLPPFHAQVLGLDAFPNRRRVRVLWCGISEGAEEMHQLAQVTDAALKSIFPTAKEERFHPHITIARARGDLLQPEGARAIEWEAEAPRRVSFTVHEVSIMKSQLRPEGPEYTRLWAVPLAGSPAGSGRSRDAKR